MMKSINHAKNRSVHFARMISDLFIIDKMYLIIKTHEKNIYAHFFKIYVAC